MRLAGSKVLVTGASSGIGAALARLLAEHGAIVAILARRADRLAAVLEQCQQHTPASRLYVTDLSDPEEAERAVLQAWDDMDGLDIVVNNAAIPKRRLAQEITVAEVQQTMLMNFESPIRLTLAVLPRMLERDHGMIVNVGSFGGRVGIPGEAAYCASKFALAGWSESMALDLCHTGVDVRLILPGAIATEIWEQPGNDAPLFDGPFETAESVGVGIMAAIEGDAFEAYLPNMLPIVEMKTSDIDGFFAATVAFADEQRRP